MNRMKLDLCKMLGVKEEEVFKFNNSDYIYKIKDNIIYFKSKNINWTESCIELNDIKEIIKLPKKPSDKVINFFKFVNPKWNYIAKDKDKNVYLYTDKPSKNKIGEYWDCIDVGDNICVDDLVYDITEDKDIFDFLSWEDEEPFNISLYK